MTGAALASPVAIGRREAPARVVFGPHETNLASGRAISERHVAYYARRAAGGAGVIVTETASVNRNDWPYERAPLAGDCRAGWQAVANACRPYGTIVLAGIGHAGGQGSSAYSQEVMWAPSRVADVVSREPPADLDPAGIDAIVDDFAWSATEAVGAGADGVEIDAGAFSLLRQFQSGLTNQRADIYGEDRLRFTREVLAAVRRAIGPGSIVALRLSCDEMAPWAGITAEQATTAVASLAGELDLLTVVRVGPFSTGAYRPDFHTPPVFNEQLCRSMRDAAAGRVPVALQGSVVDVEAAAAALASGVCDLIEMTRAQIAEPRLVSLVRAGQAGRIRPCLLCNQACRVRDNRNPIVSCVGEPGSGHETEEPYEPYPTRSEGKPVLVVGSGPAGLECARVLAEGGRRVRVADRGHRAGGTPVAAAVGPGRERLRVLSDWLVAECTRMGVEFSLDTEVGPADVDAARSDGWEVVLATGARLSPSRLETAGDPVVVDPLQLLASGPDSLPDGPVVVHDPVGDQVGVGVAEWLAPGPRPVTIVSPDPIAGTLLARTGDLADANSRLQRAGVARQLRTLIRSAGNGRVGIEDVWTGEASSLPAATIVECGPRLPDDSLYRALGDAGVLRVGDCVAPRTILEAVLEGRRAALRLLGAMVAEGAHA